MKVIRHRRFLKNFRKLDPHLKSKVLKILENFIDDPFSPHLCNHPLHGSLIGKRAIKIDYDLRIVFQEFDQYALVVFLDVGTHAQIY